MYRLQTLKHGDIRNSCQTVFKGSMLSTIIGSLVSSHQTHS